jgi:hypothetical protein
MRTALDALLEDVLASYDADPDTFSMQRAQDESLEQMADLLLSSEYRLPYTGMGPASL